MFPSVRNRDTSSCRITYVSAKSKKVRANMVDCVPQHEDRFDLTFAVLNITGKYSRHP